MPLVKDCTQAELDAALEAVGPPPPPKWSGTKGVDFHRILWTLALAKELHRGPMTAADIAKLFSRHGSMRVPKENIARAFRRLKADAEAVLCWDMPSHKRYAICPHGRTVLKALGSDAKWRS